MTLLEQLGDIAKRGDTPIKTVEVGDRIAGSLQA